MNVFKDVGKARPPRSTFDLSYDKKFNCDMGQLIPVMCDEVVPGDIFDISSQCIVRLQPTVAPILENLKVETQYFFVPYRILWPLWEEFITGGKDGLSDVALPVLNFTNQDGFAKYAGKYSLWDYFGFPYKRKGGEGLDSEYNALIIPQEDMPMAMPYLAYWSVYNNFFRDENLVDEVVTINPSNGNLFGTACFPATRAWKKDYFTSALPWQQRGVAPALPVSGFLPLLPQSGVDDARIQARNITSTTNNLGLGFNTSPLEGTVHTLDVVELSNGPASLRVGGNSSVNSIRDSGSGYIFLTPTFGSDIGVDMSKATTFDVATLRLAVQTQKFLERNARVGVRYTEFLQGHFSVSPSDARLDRPEFIGGTKSPVIISEVVQTGASVDGSPQGNLAGHGLAADDGYVGRYRVEEFGVIIGLFSIMPRASYMQGINRQWSRKTRYDFYFPEFAHLSEQAVYGKEIYVDDNSELNNAIFGYQGRYNEMRYKPSIITSDFRDKLNYWHLGREFANRPQLNRSFIECNPSKRIFVVQDEPGFLVDYMNIIKAIRPLPVDPEPGLVDHF